ncbi:YceI family protein [Mucilaginibacter polytrichastri]|nr:YceI family protein [Mucilaginibacter polytrichastri]
MKKYPKMIFKSTSIKKLGKDRYKLQGNLTVHGVTRSVSIDLWYRGMATNPMNKITSAGFQLTGNLKRSDFAIGSKFPPPIIADDVDIKS